MEVPQTTPSEAYYMEFGVLPWNIVIKARRINYLHSILKRDKRGMLYSFFTTQWYSPSPGDWTEQVKLDLDDFNIQCDFEYIERKSTDAFKRLVKRKAKDLAIENLQKKNRKIAPSCDSYLNILCIEYCVICIVLYVMNSMHCILGIVFYALYSVRCIL